MKNSFYSEENKGHKTAYDISKLFITVSFCLTLLLFYSRTNATGFGLEMPTRFGSLMINPDSTRSFLEIK